MAALLSCGYMLTHAQMQIPNGDFELWQNVGSSNEEPNDWNGLKTGSGSLAGSAPKTIQRSTTVRPGTTGTYSVRAFTVSTFGVNANGNVTTGRVNAESISPANSANYNYTVTNDAAYNAVMTDWPDSLVFWAKYNPSNQSSQARVRAVIHDNYSYRDPSASDANSPSHVVADATLNFNSNGNVWQRISIPFNYSGPATTPAFFLITYTSNSQPGGGNSGDEVFIDDMTLVYNPVTTTPSTISPLAYNVSTNQGASISIPFTKTGIFHFGNQFTAQLSDASGSFASPVNIGTLASTSAGTITGTIPAGTPSGTGYRVRVIASSPYQTANTSASDITINLVSNSVMPTAAQTIVAGSNGNTLTVSETTTATTREWKYATASGGPYTSFSPAESGTTYVPNFTNAGTYYVVCETTVGSLSSRSNEVVVTVVKNQIMPAGSQSLLTGTLGTTLTVTETPAASSREWLYSTTSGGSYTAFSPVETGTTYQPIFNSPGTYYIVCRSVINGLTATSNEVVVSVGSVNITTGTVAGSPFEFSASSPDASVNVPFTVSTAFNAGNIFTAQLSDANGSFATATTIGTLTSMASGTISATIPSSTATGNGYLVRVIGSDPAILGSDNGTALVIDQFSNQINPGAAQTIVHSTNGNTLTVSESQTVTGREWRTSTTSGGPYTTISGQTGNTYIPSSGTVGTFFVVAASTNQHGDEVISNEVSITVTNGTTLNTSAIIGSPFYVSVSANNQVTVNFTSDVIFDAGNVFTAELSNGSGSFAAPVNIGSLTSTTPGGISATIPNAIIDGNGYRIRVKSSLPSITGTDNGTNLEVINFNISLSSSDTQYVALNTPSATVNLISTHPNITTEWKYRLAGAGDYYPFTPPVIGNTFSRLFTSENSYKIIAECVNNWGDTLNSEQFVIIVSSNASINESNIEGVKAYMDGNQFVLDMTASTSFLNPSIELVNMAGQVVYKNQLQGKSVHTLPLTLASGVYTYRISENGKYATGKIPVL